MCWWGFVHLDDRCWAFLILQTDLVFRLKYDELKRNGAEHIGFYSEYGVWKVNKLAWTQM